MDEKRRAWPPGMSKTLRRRRGRLPGSKHAASTNQASWGKGPNGEEFQQKQFQYKQDDIKVELNRAAWGIAIREMIKKFASRLDSESDRPRDILERIKEKKDKVPLMEFPSPNESLGKLLTTLICRFEASTGEAYRPLQQAEFKDWLLNEKFSDYDLPLVVGSIYPDHEMLSSRNDVEADLSNQEIQVANGDDNVLEQDQANRGNNNHDGWSLEDGDEANADSENYLEHEILWNRNDAVANLGGQEIEVTTSDDSEFEQDQANSDSNNHDGSSLMVANLGGQEIEVTTSDDSEFEQDQANRDRYNHDGLSLMDVLAWIFLITNFTLELPSAVFDQLSSKDHPQYALIMMLISFIALMACIAELTYKGKKERVTWQWKGRVPWFYCRQTGKPLCSLWDVIGFASAFLQCVVTAINYSFIHRHHDGPIKTSALPILFAFGLLCSKFFEKPGRNRGRPDRGIAADLVQVLVER